MKASAMLEQAKDSNNYYCCVSRVRSKLGPDTYPWALTIDYISTLIRGCLKILHILHLSEPLTSNCKGNFMALGVAGVTTVVSIRLPFMSYELY